MNWDSRACNCTNGTGCAPAVAGQVVNDTASAALVAAYPQIKTAVVGGVDICVPTNNTFENNRYCSSAGSGRYLDENASVVAGWHSVARNNTEVTTCKSDDTTADMGDNAGNPNFAQLIPYDPTMAFCAPVRSLKTTVQLCNPRYFAQNLTTVEAENMTVSGGTHCRSGDGWSPCSWAFDSNLFASDVANVFMSRRAYLHADANATLGDRAEATAPIAADGLYHVMVRYEVGYRFSSPFRVQLSQGGKELLNRVYGLRTSPRAWGNEGKREKDGSSCPPGLTPECREAFGATENNVWEGINNTVALRAGTVSIALTIVDVAGGTSARAHGDRWAATLGGFDITERNVDMVLLHPNSSDIETRLNGSLFGEHEGLSFDTLVDNQFGEVFAKVKSHSDKGMHLTFPRTHNRSPIWEHRTYYPIWTNSTARTKGSKAAVPHWAFGDGCSDGVGKAVVIEPPPDPEKKPAKPTKPLWTPSPWCINLRLEPRSTTGWIDVGRMLDTFDHSELALPVGNYSVTFGVKDFKTGEIAEIFGPVDAFPASAASRPGHPACSQSTLIDASIRASRRLRPDDADFWRIYGQLKDTAVHGRPPTEVPIFAYTFSRGWLSSMDCPGTGVVNATYSRAQLDFEMMMGLSSCSAPYNETGTKFGFVPASVTDAGLQKMVDEDGVKNDFSVAIKLGDEIHLPGPETVYENESSLDAAFAQWLLANGVSAESAGCETDGLLSCTYNKSIAHMDRHPGRFYFSNRFAHDFGILNSHYKNQTDTLTQFQNKTGQLTNVFTAANFPPSIGYSDPRYNTSQGRPGLSWGRTVLPEVHMWVRSFREKTFTLPWSEDYMFWMPVASSQQYDMVNAVQRAAIRPAADPSTAPTSPNFAARAPLRRLPRTATTPSRPIMQYVMLHDPGNTPRSHRRRFFASLAHGVKWIHL